VLSANINNFFCCIRIGPSNYLMSMKRTIFWSITPCSPLKMNRRFGGTYRLHLQVRRISRARNQRESSWQVTSACNLISLWFLARLIRRPRRWRRYDTSKRWLTFDGLHGVIFQKIVLFKTTDLRTSNPTYLIISE
jgi:hypothetical protein